MAQNQNFKQYEGEGKRKGNFFCKHSQHRGNKSKKEKQSLGFCACKGKGFKITAQGSQVKKCGKRGEPLDNVGDRLGLYRMQNKKKSGNQRGFCFCGRQKQPRQPENQAAVCSMKNEIENVV